MQELILSHYNWFRALHVVAVISWMAGLLYLPRLFVYHADAEKGSELSEVFKIMERKLLRLIMNPAMIVTLIVGGLMLWTNDALLKEGWMHAKITAVLFLAGFHMYLARCRKNFVKDRNRHTAKFYRKINEIPTFLMVMIVIMVIVRPF